MGDVRERAGSALPDIQSRPVKAIQRRLTSAATQLRSRARESAPMGFGMAHPTGEVTIAIRITVRFVKLCVSGGESPPSLSGWSARSSEWKQ